MAVKPKETDFTTGSNQNRGGHFRTTITTKKDSNAKAWLSYKKPEYPKGIQGLPDELVKNMAKIRVLVVKAFAPENLEIQVW
jgi:hypothetical protein